MQTFFYETLNSIFSKNISEIYDNVKFCLQFPYIKFASHVLCKLTKFRDFLKPVTVRETHDMHVGHF